MGHPESPLAIVQARVDSTRVRHKMLRDLAGKPLIWWGVTRCQEHFGRENVVLACPRDDAKTFAKAVDALIFGYPGRDWDVLGRLHACAHRYRLQRDTPIHRITPDDFPVEFDREVLSIAQLDQYNLAVAKTDRYRREHVGVLWGAPPVAKGTIEINTEADFIRAEQLLRPAL